MRQIFTSLNLTKMLTLVYCFISSTVKADYEGYLIHVTTFYHYKFQDYTKRGAIIKES